LDRAIAHLSPHSLRRTLASILAGLGVAPRRAMYPLGHSDAKFTMRARKRLMGLEPTTFCRASSG
jgi:integrase